MKREPEIRRTVARRRLGAVALACAVSVAVHAEIVDRVAVSVGTQVITQSELNRATRITQFLNGDPLDLSAAARKKVAERLVEVKLVNQELAVGKYPPIDPKEIDPAIEALKRERFRTEDGYRSALETYGISESQLRDYLLMLRQFAQFTEIRFQPGIQVTEEEIRERFAKEAQNEADRSRNPQKINFEEMHDRIEQILTSERVNQEMETWLKAARSRARIRYHEDAFK